MKNDLLRIMILIFCCFYGELSMANLRMLASGFNAPTGIAFDRSGMMYVTNWSGDSIVKVNSNGKQEIFYSGIASPAGIVIDKQDNVYVSSYRDDYILKIKPNGQTQKISEGYHTPTGIAFSNDGQLLVTNRSTGEIVALDLETKQKTILAQGLTTPVGVTQLADNSLIVSQYSGNLTMIQPNGNRTELGDQFDRPGVGIVTISSNIVAVIDHGAGMVRQIDIKTKKVTTLASSLSGAVGLAYYKNRYYIGVWGNGSIYRLDNN